MTRERYQSIPQLTAREGKGQVCYPPEFWRNASAPHAQRKDSVALWIVAHDRALSKIACYAAFFAVVFIWTFVFFGGLR